MRVLVTGHHGYVGTVLAGALVSRGHDVVGLDSDLFADCVHGPAPADVPSLRVDLRDVETEHVAGVDAICHLAALSNDPLGDVAPEHTWAVNHAATVRLARLAREAGVRRFVYSSSCSVYGAAGGDDLVDESAPLRPVTPYAASKVQAEQDLHALADEDFSPVSLRNATVHGWSPRLRVDLVLNDLVVSAVASGEARVLSDGTPWRPLVHVADCAAAFVAAVEAPRDAVHGQALNVGSEADNHRVADLAAVACEAVPGSRVVITGERGADARSYRVDFRRVRERLPAWAPAWTAARGARDLAEAISTWGLTPEQARSRFTRLARLAALQAAGAVGPDLRPA